MTKDSILYDVIIDFRFPGCLLDFHSDEEKESLLAILLC